jgi:predicted metal-dependent HD superfamily phosphohydrolase
LKYLEEFKGEIKNWDAALCALFYHDIIYNTLKTNNQEKSAALAMKRLKAITVNDKVIRKCAILLEAKMESFYKTEYFSTSLRYRQKKI